MCLHVKCVFACGVCVCVCVCVRAIMAIYGPGENDCTGNYHRDGFEYSGRCLPGYNYIKSIALQIYTAAVS